ncbi:MAG: tRNA uridine-5-carboxymethylaminomethyl(34) synthesis GTPase MnmE [Peptoniphilaceae bacterium]|nr:tRNA uridine-5-carboxymethylaminomethyl(34) synthesis GTPase MnmE [Peptoniphilaceae bacterium]MDY3738537.1 tRNA uridine-5-carboxymethylaminomethyl(34) synthesis GTPase MnmE [Peptoniphilaceae bacterium]
MKYDTIAAISTPIGIGGISIIRMSGEKSLEIINKIFKPSRNRPIDKNIDNKKMIYGVIEYENEEYDEVMVNFSKAPSTYTREDVCEINCHGSMISTKNILNLLLDLGCRIADPGEFTKRAFLNGRIDLSQAEAVIDIINSTNDLSQKNALNQLKGSIGKAISDIREDILNALSRIEYSINFTEDGEDISQDEIIKYIKKADFKIKKLVKTANKGKILKNGVNTTIIGKPNVGKSSLLNKLLRENRAIVTDIPGTTRDSITEYLNIGGITLKINDTAGIRESEDEVEKIGVKKSQELLLNSDLVIAVFDTSRKFDQEDDKILKLIEEKPKIIILNKIDLESNFNEEKFKKYDYVIKTSMKENIGIETLENFIVKIFDAEEIMTEDVVINNVRHERLLNESLNEISSSLNDILSGISIDAVEVDLRSAYNHLGEITGQTVGDEILDKVFKEFCVGK